MNDQQFDAFVEEHKRKMAAYRQQVAHYVVRMGHEPQSWPETREIAENEVAGERGDDGASND